MNFRPAVTFVDKNGDTLQWAKDLHEALAASNDTYYCEDANCFVQTNTTQYDLIVVDVFEGRVVPDFVLQEPFLRHCKNSLNTKGILVMNYIQQQTEQWNMFYSNFKTIFPKNEILPLGTNKILIAYNFAD